MNIGSESTIFLLGLLGLLVLLAFIVWINCQVLHKAGFSRWWVLVAFVPIVNLAGIWLFAFLDWPNVEADSES